jgi:hypothetical protein
VIWSLETPTSEQITLEQKAAHKKPVSDWLMQTRAKFGSGHFLEISIGC